MKYESAVITYFDEVRNCYVREISQDNVLTLSTEEYTITDVSNRTDIVVTEK